MKLPWMVLSLSALVAFTIMATMITYLSRKGYPTGFVLFGIGIVFIVAYFTQTMIATQFKFPITISVILLLIIIGILSAYGNWAMFQAAADAPNPGLAISIGSLYGGATALIAVFLFKDKLTPIQIAGLVLSMVAIFFISAGASTSKTSKVKNPRQPTSHLNKQVK